MSSRRNLRAPTLRGSALLLTSALALSVSPSARAQPNADEEGEPVTTAPVGAEPAPTADANLKLGAKADAAPAPTAQAQGKASSETAAAGAPPEAAPPSPETGCGRGKGDGFGVSVCGFAALNVMKDSTQSFSSNAGNNIVWRQGTYRGNHDQLQFTARDSRLTFEAHAPETHGIHLAGTVQFDFNGYMPTETTETEQFTLGPVRMRLAYFTAKTPVLDVLAGQYHDLFGWGGSGFYPATLAFLGVTGEVYHRQPQLRLSKTIGDSNDALNLEIAAAAVRPVQKDSGVPDAEAGLRLALNSWKGAAASAYGQPGLTALGIGVSGIARRFEVAEFLPLAIESQSATGWGFAANAVLPVIPVRNNADRSNALTLTGEFSMGTGISDMYSDLTGGALFPALPNDGNLPVPPLYQPNVDSGIVTWDANRDLKTIDWRGFVIGAQYYLPVAKGRVWLSGIFAQIVSKNVVELTPRPNRGNVFDKAQYIDGSLFVALTEQWQTAVSLQTVEQTFGDGFKARNNRLELGTHYFF
jgi:hypothetical protein